MKTKHSHYIENLDILQPLITSGMKGLSEVATKLYNLAMRFERELHLGAQEYERANERDGYANGYKHKALKTKLGTLHLQVPQVRNCSRPFYPRSLERGMRSDRALNIAVAEMYIRGISTRSVEGIFKGLCDITITADQVSRAMKELDAELEKWRNRAIGQVKALFLDATYHKVRVDGAAVSLATFIVIGVLEDGHKAILAVDADLSENEEHWSRVLSNLKERGMKGVKLIVSDSHDGLRAAREKVFPGIPWQRCQMHLQKNAQAYVTKQALKQEVAQDIRSVFNAESLEEAQRKFEEIIEKYAKTQSRLSRWMEENIPEGLTVFAFPMAVRQFLRTNNMEENLNKQIKKRTRLIPVFPNVDSLKRLVSAICLEISDEWEASEYRYMSTIKDL